MDCNLFLNLTNNYYGSHIYKALQEFALHFSPKECDGGVGGGGGLGTMAQVVEHLLASTKP
jgi:hypothetical protein